MRPTEADGEVRLPPRGSIPPLCGGNVCRADKRGRACYAGFVEDEDWGRNLSFWTQWRIFKIPRFTRNDITVGAPIGRPPTNLTQLNENDGTKEQRNNVSIIIFTVNIINFIYLFYCSFVYQNLRTLINRAISGVTTPDTTTTNFWLCGVKIQ